MGKFDDFTDNEWEQALEDNRDDLDSLYVRNYEPRSDTQKQTTVNQKQSDFNSQAKQIDEFKAECATSAYKLYQILSKSYTYRVLNSQCSDYVYNNSLIYSKPYINIENRRYFTQNKTFGTKLFFSDIDSSIRGVYYFMLALNSSLTGPGDYMTKLIRRKADFVKEYKDERYYNADKTENSAIKMAIGFIQGMEICYSSIEIYKLLEDLQITYGKLSELRLLKIMYEEKFGTDSFNFKQFVSQGAKQAKKKECETKRG